MAGMLNQSSGNGTAPRIMPAAEMSAHQRNQTFDATIQQLNLVIVQVNALTQQVNALQLQAKHAVEFSNLLKQENAAIWKNLLGRTFWQRLRWLLTGR